MNFYIFLGSFILQIIFLLTFLLLRKSTKSKTIKFNGIMIIFTFNILVAIYILCNASDFF